MIAIHPNDWKLMLGIWIRKGDKNLLLMDSPFRESHQLSLLALLEPVTSLP